MCMLHWFEIVFWQQNRAYKIEGRERTDPCGNRRVGSISCLVHKIQILASDRSPKNARDEGGHSRFVLLDTLRDKRRRSRRFWSGRGSAGPISTVCSPRRALVARFLAVTDFFF